MSLRFLAGKKLNVGSIGTDNSACSIDGNIGVRGATRNIVSQIRVAGITTSPCCVSVVPYHIHDMGMPQISN